MNFQILSQLLQKGKLKFSDDLHVLIKKTTFYHGKGFGGVKLNNTAQMKLTYIMFKLENGYKFTAIIKKAIFWNAITDILTLV